MYHEQKWRRRRDIGKTNLKTQSCERVQWIDADENLLKAKKKEKSLPWYLTVSELLLSYIPAYSDPFANHLANNNASKKAMFKIWKTFKTISKSVWPRIKHRWIPTTSILMQNNSKLRQCQKVSPYWVNEHMIDTMPRMSKIV